MDDLDRDLLNRLQDAFPATAEPFRELGKQPGLEEEEILNRIRSLRERGLIRRIGAVFSPDRLGFVSTLCTAKVPDEKVDLFIDTVNALTGVTHHYRRNHEYNYWFTLICPSREALEATLADVERRTGLAVISMPAVKTFKINARFQL
ncbi:MAG: Lrp/AsnC family transcriptional regulator [Deltaproteobacteria bacterium]|jgi:DNA-binding Lrp family transcriptional regulator|nr:Lrp/AsnC family transcriptional regulator [Deltaproteobacteria bacterium]